MLYTGYTVYICVCVFSNKPVMHLCPPGSSPSHVVPAARWPGAAASFWPLPPASRRPRACAAACSAAWRSPCTGGFSGRSCEIHGKWVENNGNISGIS